MKPSFALESPHSMAVGTDKFALGDLCLDHWPTLVAIDDLSNRGDLLEPRQMIEVHGRVMEDPTTVGAWTISLQLNDAISERLAFGFLPEAALIS